MQFLLVIHYTLFQLASFAWRSVQRRISQLWLQNTLPLLWCYQVYHVYLVSFNIFLNFKDFLAIIRLCYFTTLQIGQNGQKVITMDVSFKLVLMDFFMVRPRTILESVSGLVGRLVGWLVGLSVSTQISKQAITLPNHIPACRSEFS